MDKLTMTNWSRPKSTAKRPLLGITILLVEDSRYCSEALRLLSIRSGARLRRADCLKAARRHLRIYRPDVAVVDLGLPDGSGVEVIKDIMRDAMGATAIIATSGDTGGQAREDALAAGASFFMEKPISDLACFQQTILGALPDDMKPKGFIPRLAGSCVVPDSQAMKDDLDHINDLMGECVKKKDNELLSYAAQFLCSLGRDANSKRILQSSEKLKRFSKDKGFSGDAVRHEFQIIQSVVDSRLAQDLQVY
ncbi:response regulator [Amylibacter sp. SFDW26]|uniref:response regulator transcription factor n=1 Tax=Amylibacter sp. SFDW26 TaxID=2652722 RepID=UPI001261C4F6|nr:response regulator [Amylibacter sp. SFDW26]KAB7610388.1 response regulator [Amylibacter sp. SFDW26]